MLPIDQDVSLVQRKTLRNVIICQVVTVLRMTHMVVVGLQKPEWYFLCLPTIVLNPSVGTDRKLIFQWLLHSND